MTVIAYKDGLMAGDSCWSMTGEGSHDGLIVNVADKLVRLRSGGLYGAAGAVDDRQLLDLLHDVHSPEMLPDVRKLRATLHSDILALLVLPDGSIWEVATGEDEGGIMPVKPKFHAVGIGRSLALGAMAQGANARRAIEIACEFNVYCRGPVTALRLRGQSPPSTQ
jgi:hypothetical protein